MLRSRLALSALVSLALIAAPAAAVKRRAFVTSVAGSGNLASWADAGGQTGLAAGDQICRARAAAAGLPNADAYRVWLSTSTTDAYCHVRGLAGKRTPGCTGGPPQAAGPWYLSNGVAAFAGSIDELTEPGGVIYRPAILDELGNATTDLLSRYYWTGTSPSGALYDPALTCGNWTSESAAASAVRGTRHGTAQLWTLTSASPCNTNYRLLCLEPGVGDEVPAAWGAGSIAFVSSATGTGDLSSWAGAGGQSGLAAGDAICRSLAADAHLPEPESFVAWLSDAPTDARDRVTAPGPFRRVDGFVVAGSRTDLLDGTTDNSLHVDETGAYLIGSAGGQVLTGTLADGTASAEDCLGWTSSAALDVTQGTGAYAYGPEWTENGETSCSYTSRLYCFSNAIVLFWDGFDATGDASRWSSFAP